MIFTDSELLIELGKLREENKRMKISLAKIRNLTVSYRYFLPPLNLLHIRSTLKHREGLL